jgi:hypothetical protein
MVSSARHYCIIACAIACTLSAAEAAERYEGVAYFRGTDHLAYRETDWLFMRDGVGVRTEAGTRQIFVQQNAGAPMPFRTPARSASSSRPSAVALESATCA